MQALMVWALSIKFGLPKLVVYMQPSTVHFEDDGLDDGYKTKTPRKRRIY